MTFPKEESDLLMFAPSYSSVSLKGYINATFSLTPVAPVDVTLEEV